MGRATRRHIHLYPLLDLSLWNGACVLVTANILLHLIGSVSSIAPFTVHAAARYIVHGFVNDVCIAINSVAHSCMMS